ncbi:MAG: ABC transporter ATP-binding protein, partial [Acetatifactor sp.]|nr:ABC transporter ATP-binding protein [Acetatifactor sp.]
MAEQRTARGPAFGPGRRGAMGAGPRVENPGKVFKRIVGYVFQNYAIHCLIVLACLVGNVLASVQGTLFLKTLIDDYIKPLLKQTNPDFTPLLYAMGRVALFYLLGVICAYTQSRIMVNVTQGTMKRLRDDMFAHMSRLPIKYFDTHTHGDIMSVYTNDIDTLRQMISQSIPQMISSGITIVSVLASMISLNIWLTILSLIMVGIMLFTTKNVVGRSGKYFKVQQEALGKLNGFIEERMEGQKVVKVFCHEEKSKEEFKVLNDALFDCSYNANKFANLMGPISMQLGNLSYVVVACAGSVLALNGIGGFTLGGLVSFLTFNKSFNMPINQVSQQLNSIVMALAGGKRVFDLLDEKEETDNGYVTLARVRKENGKLIECAERTGMWAWKHTHQADGSVDYVELKGDVVFDGVDFGYTDDKMVLHDIRMYAQPGQKIAFVGSTGAGKTTITNLINRFY